ncbi:MAG TPA: 2-oxoglutarate and iron-dependent oxygenase domain-containing protein [Candidatus Polarisedimenticolaceae bacterium]|nr:2-oxoglutarate and iron-dependent oxygenase domain-containing protein [Candidatus Polarisedimenticolaceae bacterium]
MDRKQHGIEATNREFARYDQVDKPQQYRLAETAGGEEFDEDYPIRSCDFGLWLRGDEADRRRFAAELGAALQEIGFAVLHDTGIDPALYDQAVERVLEFFERTPLEQKLRYRAERHGSVNQGYFPIAETSDIHPDQVEGWVFCRRAFDLEPRHPFRADEFWPRPEFEPFFRRLWLEHERLVLPIMQSLLGHLGSDPHLYDRRLTGTNFGLRLNYYPPLGEAATAGRLLGHEDVDLFTLLPAPAVEGLQVLHRRNSRWVRLDAPRGTLVLNTGDYMQRITNDVLPSTTHRVSQPRDPSLRGRPRVSFPMAVYLWEDELLEVLPSLGAAKYPPVKAIAFHTHCTSKFYGDGYAVDD